MCSLSSSVRHSRLFSTAVSSAISISAAKSRLRREYDPDKALEILSSISDPSASFNFGIRYAQDITIKRLAKYRRFDDIETFIEAQKKNPRINQEPYLSALIRSYGQVGMFDHAFRTFNQMDEFGTPRSAISFNALLSACNKSKKFDQVPKLFSEISQKYSISPDKFSYGILIKSLCESGSPDLVVPIVKEMEEKDVEITAITYTTILDCLYKKGKVNEAEKIWKEMIQRGCSPDVTAYNVRIMDAHRGRPEDVLALMDEMRSAGLKPDTISYNYLLLCYFKNGMIEEAKKVYEGLHKNGCYPNAATFRFSMHYLCRNEDFDMGFKVFKQSVTRDKIPDFGNLRYLVEGLVKNSKLEEAEELIKTVKEKFPAEFLRKWKKVEKEFGLNVDTESPAQGDAIAST